MIIRRGERLIFIRQTDHAALAAALMASWRPGGLPEHPRRDDILTATREHDNGWREEDDLLHVAGGEPLDFIGVPAGVKQRIWPRAAARLAPRPYVAALVAQHALTVHAPLRTDRAWQPFFRTMEAARDAGLARAAPCDAATLAADYPLVQAGDQLSLIFCNAWRTPMTGLGYRALLREARLEITPDPFAGARVPLRVDARALPLRAYASRADLQQAYLDSPVITLEGEAAGA